MERSELSPRRLLQRLPTLFYDILMVPLAWFIACGFELDAHQFFPDWHPVVLLTAVQVLAYYSFRVYRGLWRYASLKDAKRIIKSVLVTTMLAYPVFQYLSWFEVIPHAFLILHSLVLVSLLSTGRIAARVVWDNQNRRLHDDDEVKQVLIIGGGSAAEGLIREMSRTSSYVPVGILDDDRKKRGHEVHGVRVLGRIPQLPEIAALSQANLIVIAIPSAGSAAMRRIVKFCESSRVSFQTLPSLAAITSGHVEVNMIKKVKIEDLLGRDQVQLEWDKINTVIEERKVAITGAGGSIGSELSRQIAALKPSALLLIENSEPNLFHIEQELHKRFPGLEIQTALVSVVDRVAIKASLESFRPAVLFHAAAYKHVPLLEHQTRVAVRNNVVGTCVVAEASVEVGVEKFVLISTDKAVNPTNVMGTTKRVAEIFCQNLNEHVSTEFITVRFGNVLGSVGSVVPMFQKQLEAGGPLTVTHPDVQRYFMTIPEASQLILQAMVSGQGGEIFVLDMGDPIKITYLAEQMIRLAGKVPGKDIQLEFTGLRPGEKLFEELFHPSEGLKQTEHEKLFIARFRSVNWEELTETMKLIQSACEHDDNTELLVLLKSLVPEFQAPKLQSEAEEVLTEV